VGVDPRLELLMAVQLLSGYPYLTPYSLDYARDFIDHFSSLQAHSAVSFFRALSAGGGWSDAYPAAVLYLSDPPELEERFPLPPRVYHAFRGPENLATFLASLRDFATQARFMRFFADQEGLYLRLASQVQDLLGDHDPVEAVEEYYGSRQTSYHLVLSPLLHHGGFGPHLGRHPGPYDVYTLLGPTGARRGQPLFGPRQFLLQLVWHEFSHAFVNPLTEDHAEEILRFRELYLPIAEPMQELGYGRWLDCANEHIIRAITARLAHRVLGPEAGRQALRQESSLGFRYVHSLAHGLEEYETHRDRYPTFAAFFPELVALFAGLRP
jgi:hypothetical protein